MRRWVLALAFGLLWLAPPSAATASADFFDWVFLERIHEVLVAIHEYEVRALDALQVNVFDRIRFFVWAQHMADPINTVMRQVTGISNEVASMACGWNLNPQFDILRQLHLTRVHLCKPQLEGIWGRSAWGAGSSGYPSQMEDTSELGNYLAALTANTLSSRSEVEGMWARVFRESYPLLAKEPLFSSAGAAQRWEAMLLSMDGQVASANNQVKAQRLLLEQTEWDLERRAERQKSLVALDLARTLAGVPMGGEQ